MATTSIQASERSNRHKPFLTILAMAVFFVGASEFMLSAMLDPLAVAFDTSSAGAMGLVMPGMTFGISLGPALGTAYRIAWLVPAVSRYSRLIHTGFHCRIENCAPQSIAIPQSDARPFQMGEELGCLAPFDCKRCLERDRRSSLPLVRRNAEAALSSQRGRDRDHGDRIWRGAGSGHAIPAGQ